MATTIKMVEEAKPVVEVAAKPTVVIQTKPKAQPGIQGVKLQSVSTDGAPFLDSGITYTIYYPKKDLKGNRKRLNYWTGQGTMIQTLKAGAYHVVTKRANANAAADIVIEANKVLDLKVVIK